MNSFIKEALLTIKTSGTVMPSSKYLIKYCLKHINFSEAKTIVEFGSGNGCITQSLLEKANENAKIFSFEINPNFHNYCLELFKTNNKIIMINDSATKFYNILNDHSINQIDYIVSSLPLALLKEKEVEDLLKKAYLYLKKGGVFIQYQYTPSAYNQLVKVFDRVQVDFTFRNFPPAFIYKCQKK